MNEEKKEGAFRLNPKYASASTIQLANSAYTAGIAFHQAAGFTNEGYTPDAREGAFGFLLGYASALIEAEHERRTRETLRNARPAKGYGELV